MRNLSFSFSLILFVLLAGVKVNLSAQNNLVTGNVGVEILTKNGSLVQVPFGASYERALNDKSSIGGSLHFTLGDVDRISVIPHYNFYIKEVFDGFHVGPYVNVGAITNGFGGGVYGAGANVGYMININGKVVIDPFAHIGYGVLTSDFGGSVGVLQFFPGVRVGATF